MSSILDKIQTIGDYQRAEQEFQLRKQKALAEKSGSVPATLQVAGAIKTALDHGDVETANRIMQVHRSGAYGVNTYGDPTGQVVQPYSLTPTKAAPQATQQAGVIPQILNTLQGQQSPNANAWQNPDAQAMQPRSATPTAGVADVIAANAAKKKGAEEQAQKDVDVVMNPQIAGGEANAKNASELNYSAPIMTAKKTADINATQVGDLNKKADSANVMTSLTDEARAILQEGKATGSILGAAGSLGKRFVGRSDDSTRANSRLDVIAGNLTSAVPRMEGPQSDADRLFYKEQAGKVNDKTVPLQDRLAALEAIDGINAKYAGINTPQKNILKEGPPKFNPSKLPIKAAQALKAKPSLAAEFDAKYGQGASKMVLGK